MSVGRVLVLVRRHGKLLLYLLAFSTALTVINSSSTQALIGVDPQELLRDLHPANVTTLLEQKKAEEPSNKDVKSKKSDSATSSSQTSSSSKSLRPSDNSESVSVQSPATDLAPLPTINTPLLPYPNSSIPHGYLVKSNVITPAAAVNASNAPVFAASSQGWKVAGLAWYWWLVVLGLVAVASRWGIRRQRELARNKVSQ